MSTIATATKLRAIVVDDSSLYRKIVRDVLSSLPDVEVVGMAHDGEAALERITALKPDLVALDLEMPRLNGLGVLRELARRGIDCVTLMISAFTAEGAQATTEALREGAFDFILKPTTSSLEQSIAQLRSDLAPRMVACRSRIADRTARRAFGSDVQSQSQPRRPQRHERVDVVGIGISTGGPQALTQMLPRLPSDFPCPIVIVQHMPPMFTKSLADDLDRHCAIAVREAEQGQPLCAGTALVAPGGKQMKVVASASGPVVQLTDDAPERNCRPSVDYLFRSLAELYGARTLGVVMTGMGDDGTEGCRLLANRNASLIAQDAASCVVYGMPKSVVEAGYIEQVVPLSGMAAEICRIADIGRNR